ncbi:MAG: HAMP domain-containing sensor histidine kinase [Hydrogenophaga sp.]|nr:HAMP domain-containing sensor histidine kinase [Hydrogenophaga sp.]
MTRPDSLRRRIIGAFLLFAFGSSLLFAVVVTVAIEGIEAHLVDNRLQDIAEWASPRHSGNLPVEMPSGMSFHHGDSIPTSLRGLPPGVQDIEVDGVGLHVLTGKDAAGDYVVVDHESDYDKVELVVYSLFGLAFLGFMVLSMFLGGFVARHFVTPITTLAAAVEGGSSDLPLLDSKDELGVLARAFAAHTSQLRQVLERERCFTGDVSHELRTPLTVIMGAAEILMEQSVGQPAQYAPAQRIFRAAKEAGGCVNVLLLLARSPELIELPALSIGTVAAGEVERHRPLVAAKPVNLSYAGGDDFTVHASPELCATAIGNLIKNACLYTERGSVMVRLTRRSVVVEDTGPGLPEAVRATLANEVRPAASAGSGGTGLGLALVGRICEYLGATLTLESRADGGSVFEIEFPAGLTKS